MTDAAHGAQQAAPKPPQTLKQRARDELRRFLAMFAYIWAMFILFQIHEYLVLEQHGVQVEKLGFGLINALVFAKIMVVADNLPSSAWLRTKPLIVPILARSAGFAVLLVIVDSLEKVILGVFHHRSVDASLPSYGGGRMWGAVLVAVIIAYALTPFIAFEEIDRALGSGRLSAMLFGAAPRPEGDRR